MLFFNLAKSWKPLWFIQEKTFIYVGNESVSRHNGAELCLSPVMPACPGSLAGRPHPETSRQLILINTPESENCCVYFASEMGSELIYQHLSLIIRSPQNLEMISLSQLTDEKQDMSAMLLSKY